MAVLAVLAGLGVVVAQPASAVNPTITVTTATDVIDGGDGVLSLREAVIEADSDAGADTIQLAASATYDLTICGPSEPSVDSPAPAVGDLDVTDAAGLTIHGAAATIHQTCTARVIQSTTGAGPLVLDHLALVGGRSADGASVNAWGPLSLDHADISGATVDPVTSNLADATVVTGIDTTVTDSVIHDNDGMGLSCWFLQPPQLTTGDCTVLRATVRDNTSVAFAAGVASTGSLTLTDSQILDNTNTGSAGVGGVVATHATDFTRVTISGNHGPVGGIFGVANLIDSTVSANVGRGPGGVYGHLTMLRSTLSDNVGGTAGGFYSSGGWDDPNEVTSSTISGNHAVERPTPDDLFGEAGGIALTGADRLVVTNSTVTGNEGRVAGGIVGLGTSEVPTLPGNSVELVSSTVAGNVYTGATPGAQTSDIAFYNPYSFSHGSYGTVEMQGSVLGVPQSDGRRVCSQSGGMWTVVTHGYNVVADTTCPFPFALGPGDVLGNGDPMLSGLGDHGGPTETRVPVVGSPLTDRIPVGPLCPAVDQRGVSRPVGATCDVGAVEVDAAVFPDGDPYTAVSPVRLFDSREPNSYTGWGFGPMTLPIVGTHGVPGDATAVVLNVTGTDVSLPTFYTVYPSSSGPVPNASSLNLAPGQTSANLVTVRLGGDGAVKIANNRGLPNVIVDLMGYYAPAPEGTSTYSSIPPERLADSRQHTVLQTFGAHSVQSLVVAGGSAPVPAGATAVAVNITATDVSAPTFVTAYPKGGSTPNVSNLNLSLHETRANLAIVKVGADHSISLFNDSGSVNLIVDVVGYFTSDLTHAAFVGLPPSRLIDTRTSGHIGPLHTFGADESQAFTVTGGPVPADATAVVVNVTVTDSVTGTFVTVYPTPVPADLDPPEASSVNVGPFQTNPNLVIVKVAADGKVSIYNRLGTANVIVDLVGYYR